VFSEGEGTALCDLLSNSFSSWQLRVTGDVVVNGVVVSPRRLQDRVAYARRDADFYAHDMSVRQTMLFHAFLREPGTHARSRDTKGRVSEVDSAN
jgi:ABC-type multidrug transport system ATPase subunit